MQGNEFFRQTTCFDFTYQEVGNILTDSHRYVIQRRELTAFIRFFSLYDTDDFSRIYFNIRSTDTVGRSIYRDFATVRRIGRLVDIVHTANFFRMSAVQLDDDAVGHTANGRNDTHTTGRDDFTVFGYIGSFNDRYIDLSQKTITQVLCQLRQVHIEILCSVSIQQCAQIFVGLIRRTEFNSIGAS